MATFPVWLFQRDESGLACLLFWMEETAGETGLGMRRRAVNTYRTLLVLVAWLPAAALARTSVATDIGLGGVRIQAVALVDADAEVVWATLTDYDRLPRFVPGMTLSRVVSAPRARPRLIEQKGEGGLLALVLPDHVVLAMDERPPAWIGFRSVSGWVTSLRGEWRIEGSRRPVRLVYRAHVVPLLPPPPALTDGYVQQEIRLRLDAVAREAERRMAAR
jgi:hypothetical protein